tara:strand:+ start:2073 stop:3308 length:1236 start_codon:yes stop_codon:yes gene_type:complete
MSKSILPPTGTVANVGAQLPLKLYGVSGESLFDKNFVSGAADQVAYTYQKLGGAVLDIELKEGNVYSNYQEAVLEYSYLVNLHQTKNVLSDVLGQTTGTFDQDGQLLTGPDGVNLKFPRFTFQYSRRVGDGYSHEAGFGGTIPIYSASFNLRQNVQDYDLQSIISSSATNPTSDFFGMVGDKRCIIRKVFYKTPQAMWRFFGYYGGLNVVGNLLYYGQYTDDSTFEIIPVWQNKLQAMAYEDHLFTRLSHYSYEIHDTQLRIFPTPQIIDTYNKMWVEFSVSPDAWENNNAYDMGIDGINNLNTIPFDNIPYANINAIGKQWIRRFALALSKETLGQIRGKFASIPIPGNDTQLNATELLGQAATEQEALRTELKEILDQVTYVELMKSDAETAAAVENIFKEIPLLIYQG